jgi:hypothetical protein
MNLVRSLPECLDAIDEIRDELSEIPLTLGNFPEITNPLAGVTETGEQFAPPLSLNLPNVNAETLAAAGQANQYSNLTTQQKLDLLFPQG